MTNIFRITIFNRENERIVNNNDDATIIIAVFIISHCSDLCDCLFLRCVIYVTSASAAAAAAAASAVFDVQCHWRVYSRLVEKMESGGPVASRIRSHLFSVAATGGVDECACVCVCVCVCDV